MPPPTSTATIRFAAGLALLGCGLAALPGGAATVIIDFNDPTQANTFDGLSSPPFAPPQTANEVSTFNVTGFGFLETERNTIYASILSEIDGHYHNIVTSDINPLSPIPAGFELNVDFEIGDIGDAPSNGDPDYWYYQVGTGVSGSQATVGGILGVSGTGVMTSSSGMVDPFAIGSGYVWGSIFSDHINNMGGVGTALTSGNLEATVNAIAGTLSHEIGHGFSLLHINKSGVTTPNSLAPLMGTGAIDLPNADRILDREFSFEGQNAEEGGATQFHVQQLVNALGLRSTTAAVPEPSTTLLLGMAALVLRGLRSHQTPCAAA